MLILLEELILQVFLWILQLIDGLFVLFSSFVGTEEVVLFGKSDSLVNAILSQNSISFYLSLILVFSFGLAFLFSIISILKNMVTGGHSPKELIQKTALSLIFMLISTAIVLLVILISGELLSLFSYIFDASGSTSLSLSLLDACTGKWNSGYSIYDININSITVRELLGDYGTSAFGIWPTSYLGNGMIDPNRFYFFPAILSSISILFALLVAILNLTRRIFEMVYLYLIMPISISLVPLDFGRAVKRWSEEFFSRILIAFGSILSFRLYIALLPCILNIRFQTESHYVASLGLLFFLIGGAYLIPGAQMLMARVLVSGGAPSEGGTMNRTLFRVRNSIFHTIHHLEHTIFRGTRAISKTISKKVKGDKK